MPRRKPIMKFMKSSPESSEIWLSNLRRILQLPAAQFPKLRHTSPNLAYGRHRGPSYPAARPAAVLILLYPDAAGAWQIPLVIRAADQRVHSGEIALPGGRCEQGERPADAALREFEEETGHRISPENLIGELAPTYVFASNHQVRTFVALEPSQPVWRPDPREVAGMLQLPLMTLFEAKNYAVHPVRRGQIRFSAPHLSLDEHRVWGATLHMLIELGESLAPETASWTETESRDEA